MDNDPGQQQHLGSQQSPNQWPTQHQYPHSHHGTPAHEYTGFSWSQPMQMDTSSQMDAIPQRSHHQMLQPLVMPLWPSMLGSQASYKVLPLGHQAPVTTMPPLPSMPTATPVSASSIGSTTVPRRTLTDDDRKNMCLYHEENPSLKQTEIGAVFGVDRSTVSKVLRQREKYLERDKRGRSASKGEKGRMPEVERALSVWARNHQKKGHSLTDDSIREKAAFFAAAAGGDDNNPAMSSSWVDKFIRKHSSALSRKNSLAPEDLESLLEAPSPGPDSPKSPESTFSLSPSELRDVRSQESLKIGSPDSFANLPSSPRQAHSQSTSSLSSAFTDQAPFFTPISATGPSPSTHKMPRPLAPATSSSTQRQRSQSFPTLDDYMSPPSAIESLPKHILASSILDSPMEEFDQILESPDEDTLAPLRIDSISPQDTQKPRTVSPSDTMMRAPPLPATARHFKSERTQSPSSIEARLASALSASPTQSSRNISSTSPRKAGATSTPSPDEARRALEIVVSFFEQQPSGSLDMQESVLIGKLIEKLKIQQQQQSQSTTASSSTSTTTTGGASSHSNTATKASASSSSGSSKSGRRKSGSWK